METRTRSYTHIDSFNALQAEKMRMYYEVKLSKRKLDMNVMELESMMNPFRLVPYFVTELLRPLAGTMKEWFVNLFHGHKPTEDGQETNDRSSEH